MSQLEKRSHGENCSAERCGTGCEIDAFLTWLELPLLDSDAADDARVMQTVASLNHDPDAYLRGLEEAGLTA